MVSKTDYSEIAPKSRTKADRGVRRYRDVKVGHGFAFDPL